MSDRSADRESLELASRREVSTLRVPHDDGTRLCVPGLEQVGGLIGGNRESFRAASLSWMNVPLATIRQWGREDVVRLAREYHDGCPWQEKADFKVGSGPFKRDRLIYDDSDGPLILSGHQPELFHPGVWFKNFLLSSIAQQHSGIGVNLLIDHDLARTFGLTVPVLKADGQLSNERVAIDEDWQARPWEKVFPTEIPKWKNFDASIVLRLRSVGIAAPLLCELWPKVIELLEQGSPLGEALAAARHVVELSNGLKTLELPFSRLASQKSFACFAGELLLRIETVHQRYNAARDEYRKRHRIKNRLQPIPELARDEDGFESPFWVYSDSDPTRRPLWVQRAESVLVLSDRNHWTVEFSCDGTFETWFAEWQKLVAANIAIRPRALTTTMFLRLAVGDLFIHGIGGGAYDQLTDEIIESLWPVTAPKYLVATATLRLPIKLHGNEHFEANRPSEKDVLASIRDWRFSPERLIGELRSTEKVDSLLREKKKLLSKEPARQEKPAWHLEIQRLNSAIRKLSGVSEEQLAKELHEARSSVRNRRIWESREFSFSLFPKKSIVDSLRLLTAGE